MTRPSEADRIRASRLALLDDDALLGRALTRSLSDHADGWFHRLGEGLASGWALLATGGYGRGQLFPGSDVDVMLLHPKHVDADTAAEVARDLWYPIWDAGMKLSPSVHTERSALRLAGDDLPTATALLDARRLAGDHDAYQRLVGRAAEQWAATPWRWLGDLAAANEDRWRRAGDVSARLEPDLKDGRGGLRDVDALRWALATGRDDVDAALETPVDDVVVDAGVLVEVRAATHRLTGRTSNVVQLQDQEAIAVACGYRDADEMMRTVSAAARRIEWATGRFWDELGRLVASGGRRHRGGRRSYPLAPDVVAVGESVAVAPGANIDDPSLCIRVAAAAGHAGQRIAKSTLLQLRSGHHDPDAPWTDATRRAFLSLLGCGPSLIDTIDSLEHFGLFSRYIPEWRAINSCPQRNAFHLYTVDRHLLQTVVEADRLVRTVTRPDLLLTAALLHDIGKGRDDDHTELGIGLTRTIAERMGFERPDVQTLCRLVECHLLLAETATRRDVEDERTAELLASAVGDLHTLALLRALTEADSLATGPTSWTPWKRTLVDRLVELTQAWFNGTDPNGRAAPLRAHLDDGITLDGDGDIRLQYRPTHDDLGVVTVTSSDRIGLFAAIAAALALHGVEVLAADVSTTDAGVAVDHFHVVGGEHVPWATVEHLLHRAALGEVDLDERIAQRMANHRPRRHAVAAQPPTTAILVNNDASATATVVEVRSPDAEAMLYRLAVVLRDHDLDVLGAKVATLGHEVVDVFYVRAGGSPLTPDRHEPLRSALAEAVETATNPGSRVARSDRRSHG